MGIPPSPDRPGDFSELDLKIKYRTGEDLLNSFYIPTLRRATSYDRGAGYFDSSSLQFAAQGIAGFILNEGTLRLLMSPRLSPEDKKALSNPKSSSSEMEVLTEALNSHLFEGTYVEYTQTDRFKCLAWMIDQGFLEIKIAYMPDAENSNPFRHYHDKQGIMEDGVGNRLAFVGSLNETGAGWTENWESFRVFRSWKGESDRIAAEVTDFNRLWNNDDERVIVRDLPEAVEAGIREFSPATVDDRPAIDSLFSEEGFGTTSINKEERDLWEHQSDAIDWWRTHDYKGIFAMATGAGKTLAALRAMRLQADIRLTIVTVPSKVLLDQWREEIQEVFGSNTEILECSGRTDWRSEITTLVDPFRVGSLDALHTLPRTVFLTTLHTAATDDFQKFIDHIHSGRLQIVIDEVHRAGAPTFQKVLQIDAGRRIGLSATPDRQWDDQGTAAIYEYFGGHDPFRFTTEEAIESSYLTEYEYHPLIVDLTPDGYEEYKSLSNEIESLAARVHSDEDVPEHIVEKYERLLRDRADIKKTATRKPGRFGEFLDTDHPKPVIVFCEDTEQLETIEAELADRGLPYGVYISKREDEQADAFFRFEKGLIDYLLAIKCLDEGVDVPDCSTAVIIASSRNEREFIQRRGRVLRQSENVDRAEIYDVLVLPGLAAPQDDETAQRLIQQELERAKVLMSAAENRDQVEQQLAEELDTYGSGFRYLAYL